MERPVASSCPAAGITARRGATQGCARRPAACWSTRAAPAGRRSAACPAPSPSGARCPQHLPTALMSARTPPPRSPDASRASCTAALHSTGSFSGHGVQAVTGAGLRDALRCRCERRCTATRSCGRHQCKRRCCGGDCPPCDQVTALKVPVLPPCGLQ